jgi:hypothetical protein
VQAPNDRAAALSNDLMKLSSTFWVVFAVLIGAAVLIYTQGLRSPEGHVDVAKIRAATDAYGQALKIEGKPAPTEVGLDQLIARGLLQASDVSGFDHARVSVSLAIHPAEIGQVLMRVRLPGGKELVALNDGSVQERRGR